MIPYIEWRTIPLGPLTIQVWGLFVALGAVTGVLLARRTARRFGTSADAVADAGFWMLVFGFIGARIGYALFYDPSPFLGDQLEIFRIWHGGLSSLGGFLGAGAGLAFFLRRKRTDALALADALAHGFPWGWAIGRIGCFLIHDHPGTLSHSILAVRYPDGARWDLGLMDAVSGAAVGLLLLLATRRSTRRGVPTALVAGSYLFIRFWLDFLRSRDLPGSDVRVAGLLTPAQIGSLLFLVAGGILFWRARARGNVFRLAYGSPKNLRIA